MYIWKKKGSKEMSNIEEKVVGRFGEFGGQYIPETLMNEIHKLEEAYEHYKNDRTKYYCEQP